MDFNDGEDDLDAIIGKDEDELELESNDSTPETPEEKPEEQSEKPEEDEENEPAKPEEEPKTEEENPEEKPGEEKDGEAKSPEEEVPAKPEPLTKDDVRSLVDDIRTEERTSGKAVEQMTDEIIKSYHPEGLSNTLVDKATGREIKTPQDVVELSNNTMSIEEASQWLINKQYESDTQNREIRESARQLAETNINFKRGAETVVKRYEPLFKEYPELQGKVYKQYMNLVKYDEDKGVVLNAPDIEDFYDTMLEPYRLAYEFKLKQAATAPTPPPASSDEEKPAEPPKPTADDRLDIAGDGGSGGGGSQKADPNDPNDSLNDLFKE